LKYQKYDMKSKYKNSYLLRIPIFFIVKKLVIFYFTLIYCDCLRRKYFFHPSIVCIFVFFCLNNLFCPVIIIVVFVLIYFLCLFIKTNIVFLYHIALVVIGVFHLTIYRPSFFI